MRLSVLNKVVIALIAISAIYCLVVLMRQTSLNSKNTFQKTVYNKKLISRVLHEHLCELPEMSVTDIIDLCRGKSGVGSDDILVDGYGKEFVLSLRTDADGKYLDVRSSGADFIYSTDDDIVLEVGVVECR